MLKIKPPDYKFCPLCGTKLSVKKDVDGEERKICPNCGWVYYPHVFASANAVVVKEGRVLLVKRAIEPYKNTWMFPAGFVKYGEHPKETVLRELKEETNLDGKNPKLIDVFQSTDDPRAQGHFVFFFRVEATGNLKSNYTKENSKMGWFNIDKSPNIGWKIHRQIMKSLQEGKI